MGVVGAKQIYGGGMKEVWEKKMGSRSKADAQE